MCHFALAKHISDQVKDLRLVPLPDFHAILHGHDEILGPVFSSMLRALLRCSCAPENTPENAHQEETHTESCLAESAQEDQSYPSHDGS